MVQDLPSVGLDPDTGGGKRRIEVMAKKEVRLIINLACQDCKRRNYATKKNRQNDPDRLELNKYCPFCRKHTAHKETK